MQTPFFGMEFAGLYPRITKKYILDRITQEDIMSAFVGVPVNNQTLESNSISSPYRTDTHPSCNYYYNMHGKLRFRDHTTGLNYDCFDAVAHSIHVSSNDKRGFNLVLEAIAKHFRLNKFENYDEVVKYERRLLSHKRKINKRKKIVVYRPVMREPNYHDAQYWGNGKLKIRDLRGVYFIDELFLSVNNQPFKRVYSYSPKDPCYGYYGGRDTDIQRHIWKFYFPKRSKNDTRGGRFLSNGGFLQGLRYLTPDRICVLTKSFKDVKVFNKVGLQSCALSAESTPPTREEIFYLKSMFDFVVTCFDLDYTGCRMAWKLRKEYGLEPIMFSDGRFGTVNYGAKDAFEFTTANQLDDLRHLIKLQYLKYKDTIKEYEPKLIIY